MKYNSDWQHTNHFEITQSPDGPDTPFFVWTLDRLLEELLNEVPLQEDQIAAIWRNIDCTKPCQKFLGEIMDAMIDKLNNKEGAHE